MNYELMEEVDWPDEIKNALKGSCFYCIGYFWKLHSRPEGWFIEIRNINYLDKFLLIKINILDKTSYELKDLHLEYYASNVNEAEKYYMLYEAEKNFPLLWNMGLEELINQKVSKKRFKDLVLNNEKSFPKV